MANNTNLGAAKAAKNDEFYTQYADIQKEINAYLEYNPDTFRNKTVLLPCDDPEWSNFTRFFAQNFERLGLKRLISTSYAVESKKYKNYQPTLFETESPMFDIDKTRIKGKIFELTHDTNQNGRIILGNFNAIHYKEVFPLIRDNKIWTGNKRFGGGMNMIMPKGTFDPSKVKKYYTDERGNIIQNIMGVIWFTNLDHGRRHEPLQLMTMKDNLRFSPHKNVKEKGYPHYENYDAIDVPFTDAIPSDYEGEMGVPTTFIDKYCPEQFTIIGCAEGDSGKELGLKPFDRGLKKLNPSLRDGQLFYMENGIPVKPYSRILIRKKQ